MVEYAVVRLAGARAGRVLASSCGASSTSMPDIVGVRRRARCAAWGGAVVRACAGAVPRVV